MIVPADDSFHPPTSDDRWFTETAWYSFWVPDRRLSGTIYAWFRPNLRIAAACVALWDDTGELPWEVLHFDYQWHLPWPEGDLVDLKLRHGLHLRAPEPLQRHRVTYDNRDGVRLDLTFEGCMAPHELPRPEPGQSHYDQPVRTTGRLWLYDDVVEVDCLSIRDRSWYRRPDWVKGWFRSAYCAGQATPDHGFHAVTVRSGPGSEATERVTGGYLVRDGVCADLVDGTRTVERNQGRPVRVVIDAIDTDGRDIHVEGVCMNRLCWPNRPTNVAWMSLIRWRFDGVEAWGEDQDIWSLAAWRQASRAGFADS